MAPGRSLRVAAIGAGIALVFLLVSMGAGAGKLLNTHPVDRFAVLERSAPPSSAGPSPAPSHQHIGPTQPHSRHAPAASLPHWQLILLLTVAAGLLVLIALWFAVSVRSRRGSRTAAVAATDDGHAERERLLKQAADVRDWLETEDDPRTAVIGCWLRLEQMAADIGTPRAVDETAGELTLRVLRRWPIEAEPLLQLRARFEVARFSLAALGTNDIVTARTALVAVIDGLQAAASSQPVAASQELTVTSS